MKSFGEKLRDLRKECKISQVDLAKKTGLSQSAITAYEVGEREPGSATLNKIAEAFNVSADYLLGKTPERNVNDENDMNIDIVKIKNSFKTKKLVYDGKELPPFEEELIRRIILAAIEVEERELKKKTENH